MGAKDHQGVANFDPRSKVDRFYVGDHYTLLHTKYISCGSCGFREDFFKSFSHYRSIESLDPGAGPIWTQGA